MLGPSQWIQSQRERRGIKVRVARLTTGISHDAKVDPRVSHRVARFPRDLRGLPVWSGHFSLLNSLNLPLSLRF